MIYVITFFISLIFCKIASILLKDYKIVGLCFLFIAISIPSLLAGCRDIDVGTDTSGYVLQYFRIAKYEDSFNNYNSRISTEIGYSVFNYVITRSFKNFACLLFFIEFFVLSLISLSIINLKKYALLPWSFFVYFSLYFASSLNTTRQIMSMAVCLYSFSFLLDRKYARSLLIAFAAIAFHFTAFIFFAIFPLYYLINKISSKNFIFFQILISVSCIVIVFLLDYVITSFIGVGLLTDKFDAYTSTNNTFGSNIPLSDLLSSSVIFVIIAVFKKYYSESNSIKNFFHIIFLISVILCFSAIKSTFAVRGMYYFSFLSIIIIPVYLSKFENRRLRLFLNFSFIIFFILYWMLTVTYANLGETYPYKSKILSL